MEQVEQPIQPIEIKAGSVAFLGTEVKKGSGGQLVPNPDRFKNNTLTDYDYRLMQKIAVCFSLNQPVLIEGGSGIGKSETVDRVCALTDRESYYANCHNFEPDILMGAKTTREDTVSGFGWRDGIVVSAIRNGGVLFLDEYNFMRGDVRGRLHEVLDAILRGKNEIILIENDGEVVPVHLEFRIVCADNEPGKSYGDREVLDPAQYTRFVVLKEPSDLSQEVKRARALGYIGIDNEFTVPETEYLEPGSGLSREQLKEIPGIEQIIDKYVEFADAVEQMAKERKIGADQPQPVYFAFQRDFNRVMQFVQHFYRGDINDVAGKALRFYFANKFESQDDRDGVNELIAHVAYIPTEEDRKRRSIAEPEPEAPPAVGSRERLGVEVKRFTPEQRRALEDEGYTILNLTGESITTLKVKNMKFWSTWHNNNPVFEGLTSRKSEVAIKLAPDQFFIPGSNNKTLAQQLDLVKEYSNTLQGRIPGTEAILGEAADYIELSFQNQELFGEKYDFKYTRTPTQVGSRVANVGYHVPVDGLGVNYWKPDGPRGNIWAAPLVVPA